VRKNQLLAAISDEAGNFSADAPSGNYLVAARSQTGETWWRAQTSTKLGSTTLNLSAPAVSCAAGEMK
jgi:hypothetical protein